MKKIKYLLIFGLFTLFGIGSSFGHTGINSIFSYIDSGSGQTVAYLNGTTSASSTQSNQIVFGISPSYWFDGTGTNGYGVIFSNNTVNFGVRKVINNMQSIFNFSQNFYTPFGFSLTGLYSGNISTGILNLSFNNSLFFNNFVDYNTWDSFPIIIGDNGIYLTFSGDKNIIYNGESVLTLGDVNYLHYCFYGIDYNLSCLFSTNSNLQGFTFKSFFNSTDGYLEYDNIAVVPIHEKIVGTSYFSNFFTGGITLVLAYGNYNNNNSQGIIFNLFNCYSSNPEVLKSCFLNSKGYIDISSNSFFHRSFLSIIGNINNINSYGYGSFSDIILTGGKFLFRSNSYLNTYSSSNTSVAQSNNNCYYRNSCWGVSELPLQNDDSVVDILNNIDSETNTFSGSINLPTCINTEMCTYYTGSDGVTSVYSCTTYCLESGDLQPDGSYINVLGDIYFEKSSLDLGKTLKNKNPEYLFSSGYTDSGGLISVTYFDDLFDNGAKAIGVCPFNYFPGPLDFLSEVEVQNVYPFMPLLCFYSAFQQGKQTHYFDNSELFSDTYFSNPLLSGSSEKHLLLFRFFDVLLSIGILSIFKFLIHLF